MLKPWARYNLCMGLCWGAIGHLRKPWAGTVSAGRVHVLQPHQGLPTASHHTLAAFERLSPTSGNWRASEGHFSTLDSVPGDWCRCLSFLLAPALSISTSSFSFSGCATDWWTYFGHSQFWKMQDATATAGVLVVPYHTIPYHTIPYHWDAFNCGILENYSFRAKPLLIMITHAKNEYKWGFVNYNTSFEETTIFRVNNLQCQCQSIRINTIQYSQCLGCPSAFGFWIAEFPCFIGSLGCSSSQEGQQKPHPRHVADSLEPRGCQGRTC